jgi:PREDICTED: hypothetical protein
MTSQFKSIIEKIKTDKNVQVAVASIAAATVLVIGGTMYYVSQTHHQTDEQTYKKAASIGSEKYEKVRKDEESDTKIDDKLVESISSTTSSSSSNSSNSNNSTNSSSSSSGTSSSSNSQSVTQTNQSSQSTQSNDSSSTAETTSANTEDNRKEDSSRKTESKSKSESVKKSSSGRSSRSKRSADQSDWDENQSETRKSEEVSGDNWNDEDSVEELNLQR